MKRYPVFDTGKGYRRRKFKDGKYKFFFVVFNESHDVSTVRAITGRTIQDRARELAGHGYNISFLIKRLPENVTYDFNGCMNLTAKQVEEFLINKWIYDKRWHLFKKHKTNLMADKRYRLGINDFLTLLPEYKYWCAI